MKEEIDSDTGLCKKIDESSRSYYSLAGVKYPCDEQISLVDPWDAKLKQAACTND